MPVTRDVWAGRVLLGITVRASKEFEPPFIRDFIFGASLLEMASGLKPSTVITSAYFASCDHTNPVKNRSRATRSILPILSKSLFKNKSPFESVKFYSSVCFINSLCLILLFLSLSFRDLIIRLALAVFFLKLKKLSNFDLGLLRFFFIKEFHKM